MKRWSVADVPVWFIGAFLLFIAVGFALHPIQRTDTDLWYHLAAGRFMAASGAIPVDSSYLSFVEPPRPFADYYWLFQKLVYGAYQAGGYLALVLVRAGFVASIGAAVAFLASGGRRPGGWSAFLLAASVISFLPRFEVLRPHLAEYLFTALFLIVLDLRPAWALILPVLAVLWGNLHGISYPVLMWVCGCFLAERLLRRSPPGFDDRAFGLCAVALAAVFVTPLGGSLVSVPFGLSERAQGQIVELRAVQWADLLSLELVRGGPSPLAAQKALLAVAILSLTAALARGRARVAHVLLFLGGLGLLWRGQRFFVELILFSLPLMRENPPFEAPRAKATAVALAAAAAAMAAAFVPFSLRLAHRPAYPVTMARLPVGVAEFLKREGGGGRLMNHPDTGGWWEWELLPRTRIAVDMQTPFLFTEDDLFLAWEAYSDPETLRFWIERYRPDFIEAPSKHGEFRAVIAKFPDFVPVFADGSSVLFASRSRKPELVKRWRMPVDAFDFGFQAPEKTVDPDGWLGCRPKFVARMLEAAPRAYAPRVVAARTCIARGDAVEAEREARFLTAQYPEAAVGYWLTAEARERRKDDRGALESYRRALGRGGDDDVLHLRLAQVYERLGMAEEARRERRLGAPGAPNLPSVTSEKPTSPQS